MSGVWFFIKRFGNPRPLSRDWWISWFAGILFFGSVFMLAVLYFYFTQPQR